MKDFSVRSRQFVDSHCFAGRSRRVLLLVILSALLSVPRLEANPVGGKVVQGNATISSQGSQLTVRQTTPHAQINWSSFNIGLHDTTSFIQPSSSALVWNYIQDSNPSQILGKLNANGYVVLQNSSGFYIGGQAVITTHGLLMTTAPIPVPDLSAGGVWDFNALPPTASIINYGQIGQAAGDKGGSVFLIAADIQNKAGGTISAPEGQLGLYAGRNVLVCSRPDGRGLSAKVTLPQGSVDNAGKLIADAGTIEMNAQVVNQGGLVQANSVRRANGVIELVASDSLSLGANSKISARGDSAATDASQGGVVVVNSANTFADAAGSTVDVSGKNGGHDGLVEFFGSGATAANLQSQVNGQSASDFLAAGGLLLVNPQDLTLSTAPSTPTAPSPNLNTSDLAAFSKLELVAGGNLNLNANLSLSDDEDAAPLLKLTAGNAVTVGNGVTISAGNGSQLNVSGASIDLGAGSAVQAAGSDIRLTAAGNLNNAGQVVSDGGSITLHGQSVSQAGLVQVNVVNGVSGAIRINADGTLDHSGQAVADGGAISLIGQTINQSGLVQADAVGGLNGNVTLVAQSTLNNQGRVIAEKGAIQLQAQTIAQSGLVQANGNGTLNLTAASSIDNEGQLVADGGVIQVDAPAISQGGRVQANSLGTINGIIELTANNSLTLGAGSILSAHGDATTAGSPGGFVVLNSGHSVSDAAGSAIDVSGQNGGHDGVVEVLGNGVTPSALHSLVDGQTAAQYQSAGGLLLTFDKSQTTPPDLTLSYDPSAVSGDTLNLSLDDLSSFSKIDVVAGGNIDLNSSWGLPGSQDAHAQLRLTAGNSIVLADQTSLIGPKGWNLALAAGPQDLAARPVGAGRVDGVYLDGNSYIQTQDGSIQVWAANEVQINAGDTGDVGNNGIRTLGGGSISVTTKYGDVNTGANPQGYRYNRTTAPYYSLSSTLGGISTKAGGDVTINAGGDVISFLPNNSQSGPNALADAGTGAFGPQAGNVTINAGGSVYGHYVVANGVGSITAQRDIGAPSASQNVALSLIAGRWTLNAPNGSIYLQEVRNPNGVYNALGSPANLSYHRFDYSPTVSVTLDALENVFLTGLNLPRPNDPVPLVLPPMLYINGGTVVLQNNISLFPSPYQNLEIVTTGDFKGAPIDPSAPAPELIMSDSPDARWLGITSFGDSDHRSSPLQVNNPNPAVMEVGGTMRNLVVVADKQARISVGQDMVNCGFAGENLHAGDVTSINVKGNISNEGIYHFVILNQAIAPVPAADLPPGLGNSWNTLFSLAVDPAIIASTPVPADKTPEQLAAWAHSIAPLGISFDAFTYDPTTRRLGYLGQMGPDILAKLSQPLTVLRYGPDGFPEVQNGHLVTDTVSWTDAGSLARLSKESQGSAAEVGLGYRLGGPGDFDINANAISLGNTYGILACGVSDVQGGNFGYGSLAALPRAELKPPGATLNVTVQKNPDSTTASLDMLTSTIASLGGGNLNVTSLGGSMNLGSQDVLLSGIRQVAFGIFSSGRGNVSVTAEGNIDVAGSRIASYNGGDINVMSLAGNVNAGSGGATFVQVPYSYIDANGQAGTYTEEVFGSGIVANTLVNGSGISGSAALPGDITIKTPQGSIYASLGGVLQEALNGNLSPRPSGKYPTVTLEAGTFPSANEPGHVGNVDLGDSGVIGGTINVTANGNINGLVISRQNSTINAAQSFSGIVLSGGSANLSAGGSISGTIVGVGGINASGGQGVSATLLSQNVSVAGGQSQSTLGTSATATAASQSAAQQANSDSQQQVAANTAEQDDDLKKKKGKLPTLVRHVGRVTVILPPGS